MAINVNSTNITRIVVNGDTEIQQAQQNGSWIWAKPYTLTVVKNNSSYYTTTIYRYSTHEPTAATGSSATLVNGSTIYYYDYIYASVSTTTSTRYVSKSCSPDSFSGNYVYAYQNETITFNSYACTCGSTNSDSTCTSCLSTSCSTSASGLCTSAQFKKCNCRSTSISGAGCSPCGLQNMSFA